MSSVNSDTCILSDEDTDGMCSARIIHNALTKGIPHGKHTLLWQSWDVFGMTRENADAILALHPRTVYILDIGSNLSMLDFALEFLANHINVVILDNHPPDPLVETAEDYDRYTETLKSMREEYAFPPKETYPFPFFYYESTTENCTTGIAYSYASTLGWHLENMEKWALLGLEGDVAKDTKGGKLVFDHLMENHPYLQGLLASRNLRSTYDWSILAFYAQLLHNPRRMIYNQAPPVVYEAMKEMEVYPNWLDYYQYINSKAKGGWEKQPATKVLLDLTAKYREDKGDVEKIGNYIQLDYPDFGVNIISHKWNMGAALASKFSNNFKKTWFVINSIPGYGIHISGRGGSDGKLHIGKVFRCADSKIMEGGGIRPAGSAQAHINNVEAILDELVKAVMVSRQ